MGWPCDWRAGAVGGNHLPSLVDRIVRAGGDGPLRAEEMVLPHSWELALSFLRDLSDNGRYEMVGADWDKWDVFAPIAFCRRAASVSGRLLMGHGRG